MSKKILVLNGSPTRKGNTSALIDSFTKGATASGNSVENFFIQDMNIHNCLGCCKGGANPKSPCVQKDDMEKIYSKFNDADIIVLASPMYYWTITAQLKAVIDRLFAIAECNPNYQNPKKDCVLIMAAEGADKENFEPILHYYNVLTQNIS